MEKECSKRVSPGYEAGCWRVLCRGLPSPPGFAQHIDEATRPHQFALSTRASAEALAHCLQYQTDTDPDCTVPSVDGIIGAFACVSRKARLSKLRQTPGVAMLLPFVWAWCSRVQGRCRLVCAALIELGDLLAGHARNHCMAFQLGVLLVRASC